MKNKNQRLVAIAAILFVSAIVLYYLFGRYSALQQRKLSEELLEGTVTAQFDGQGDTSPDAPALSRLIRGKFVELNGDEMTVATRINFPDKNRLLNIRYEITPKTQYLCWPSSMPDSATGQPIPLDETNFILTDETRLFIQGETYLTRDEAIRKFESDKSLVLVGALEKPYVRLQKNRIYQIGIVGCK
jgi:hypothetical protein